MDESWIKLYRKIREKGWYKKSEYVHLWVHILVKADHEEKEFMWNGETMKTKKGQFITGRKKLSEETGITETTIERILKTFESGQQIEQQKTSRFRLISVLNWEKYQVNKQVNGQQTDNKRTTNGQQTDTDKNLRSKESKKIREEASIDFLKNIPESFIEEILEKFDIYRPKIILEAEKAFDWLKANGIAKRDYAAYLRNWIRNAKVGGQPVYRQRSSEEMREWKQNQERIAKTQESMRSGPSLFAKSLVSKMKM